ncbi:MAG: 16S rRNA (guanine(527)-N(7))-methyltransferase RsmG [Clostridia bacterium]|nr:16S rRNA (guanine(527)-N(7))-methyltransferase RsmG [Clostridia bacterium]
MNPDHQTMNDGLLLDDWLPKIAADSGVELTTVMRQQLLRLAELMREWNQRINLTANTRDEDIAIRHYLDSLTLVAYLDWYEQVSGQTSPSLIDVGTGAGFPGLVLKIVRPNWQITLLDSLAKRVRYLQTAADTLQLTGLAAVHARAEDAGRQPGLRESFDLATARAVAALPVLSEYCLPFVRVGGYFLAMKGDPESEWPAARSAVDRLGGQRVRTDSFRLPGTDMQRSIFLIKKISSTAEAYPRKAGKPENSPL